MADIAVVLFGQRTGAFEARGVATGYVMGIGTTAYGAASSMLRVPGAPEQAAGRPFAAAAPYALVLVALALVSTYFVMSRFGRARTEA